MNIRLLFSAFVCSVAAVPASAAPSVLSLRDTITDNNIVFPESFDTDTKDLMTDWYMQRYAVLDNAPRTSSDAPVSDQEYIARLQKLPTVIEMPYNSIVRQYIEMYAHRRADLVERMLSLSLYYNPIFENALERYELPTELKYLPVIESALNPNAVSKAGAAGLWQFMPSTASGEGLEVNSLIDERRDPLKASDAAANLLKKFYDIYGDWSLVLAAYNCGPGNVNKAIKNAGGKRDFWEIYPYLPSETRGYVPAFIAANYIMNNFGLHGISPAVARAPIVTDTVHISERVHFKQISDVLGLSVEELRILNPQYRRDVVPGNIKPYTLILPSVQAYCFKANFDSIRAHDSEMYGLRAVAEPAAAPRLITKYHTVKRGETLASIASEYGVTAESIKKANRLKSNRVKRGKKLKIQIYEQPAPAEMASTADTVKGAPQQALAEVSTAVAPVNQQTAPANTRKKSTASTAAKSAAPKKYKVKSGDTLGAIASRNGLTVAALKKANGLRSDRISIGQSLTIPAKSTSSKKSTSQKRKRR